MSIRLKLTLWYSSLLAMTLLILGVSIYFYVDYNTYRDVRLQIERQSKNLNLITSVDFFNQLDLNFTNRVENNVYVQLYNYTNGKLRQSDILRLNDIVLPVPEASSDLKTEFVNLKVGNLNFYTFQKPLPLANGQLVGMLQIAVFTGPIDNYLSNLRTILIFASLGVLVVAFTIGYFIAQQALRPVQNVIQAANQIKNGSNLSVRIERAGPNDEMGKLTDTLNGMLERLETTYNELDEAYKAQRRFVSDASHELRTPLTTIRGNIELLERMWLPELETAGQEGEKHGGGWHDVSQAGDNSSTKFTREAMTDIADEAKRMTRLVNDLLALARADAGYVMEKNVQPLLPLVEDVARRAALLPRTVDWRVGDLTPLTDVCIEAHADFIRQLFFIFVENAFKYTAEGYVELRAVLSRDQAGIVIADTGIGMNSDEIPHIFERFYRADVSRGKTSGTGLGLSIAKWIIDEHGGSVEVSTRESEGTTFTIWLPIAMLDEPDQV
ncbi:sensor histidine kinase [Paenibacillus sp. GCM10027626]|uniref:sensor histidine kinase n=1 Tax=Paenibacillus sp. GCM10027626 TaxID=3273411 RepID=UPI00363A078E